MFRTLLKSIGLLALFAASANAQIFIPAVTPWRLGWSNPNPAEVPMAFELFYGTNKLATLTTNDYRFEGMDGTNQVFSAPVPGVITGTNNVTLVAVDPVGQKSDPSKPLGLFGLGKPLSPHTLGKR